MADTPVYKVGAVLLRQHAGVAEVFLLRPEPKQAGEKAPWVLPRGSRAYVDAHGNAHDVRDAATAQMHRDRLEPLTQTLLRELHEEAGVPPHVLQASLAQGTLVALGARPYKTYEVYWYVLHADAAFCAAMVPPADAEETCWATLGAMQALGVAEGYQRVVREVMEQPR